ncbi:hypothetical protein LOTGIDRAFT_238101 [Lottia gigantea]|uniref:Coiled-coil domain-containing protein 177 n=1 Tax=Lottia gigantea TaxID=225164 RepID=V4B8A1_LOTGI|nr:hypothetical protein LOTGIDRAFT_238101 [Lottia gigantea]ESP01927.1 hypothetical protein LOTGIDRAFT_238101 [Lottia gigantea]
MSRPVPSLDLYNFEDNQYEESKYVLTSPRSLEACSQLGVKPIDLLYKPLSEYQEELLPEEIPLRTIFNIYDDQEQCRQTKLQLCRKERSRIIEDRNKSPTRVWSTSRRRNYSVERPSSARTSSRKQKCIRVTRSHSDDDLCTEKLQRKRTAWATSIGHKRLTHNELEARANELHEESIRLRKVLLARKTGKSPTRESRSRNRVGITSPRQRSSSVNRSLSCSSVDPTHRRSHSASRLQRSLSATRPERSLSATRAQRSLSATRAQRSLSTNRPQRSVSTSRLNYSTEIGIPRRDQKILDIMEAKRQEDKALKRLQHRAILGWDKERLLEKKSRNDAENRRRKLLAEESRIHQNKLKSKQEMKKSLNNEEEELRKERLKQKNLKWKSSFLRQHLTKEQKAADRKVFNQLKRRTQRKNLELKEMETDAYIDRLTRKQNHHLNKSQNYRDNSLEHRNKNLMMNNRNERKFHKTRKNLLEHELVDDLDKSRMMDDLRHSRAKSNYSKYLDSQYRAISLLQEARENRHAKAQESIQKMEEELESWRKQTLKERKEADKYADNVVNRVNQLKSLKAHNNRLSKELEHQQNRQRVEAEEEAWRHGTKIDVQYKNRKSDLIQREKDFAVQQMRATAKVTQELRDSIRKKYDTDTFDKKVLQAQIHANLGKRTPMKALKNRSSVELC